jgi:hypothetical protein
LGGTPTLTADPLWHKVVVPESAFTALATEESITLISLPEAGVVHGVALKHSTAFSGGPLTGYTVEVGIAGEEDRYTGAFDVFQAVGDTVGLVAATLDERDHNNAVGVLITARATDGDVVVATAGEVEVWLLLSGLKSTISAGGGGGGGGGGDPLIEPPDAVATDTWPIRDLIPEQTLEVSAFFANVVYDSSRWYASNAGVFMQSSDVVTESIDNVDDPAGVFASAPILVDFADPIRGTLRGLSVTAVASGSGPVNGDQARVTVTINGLTNIFVFSYLDIPKP